MCSGDPGSQYDRMYLDNLIACAEMWGGTPYIVNGESELDGHNEYSREIVEECGDDEWALSMIAWPFNDNDWTMFADIPVLPQLFGPGVRCGGEGYRQGWQARGVNCVVHTFGAYSGWGPELYPLDTPYGLYTADDCGGNFARWAADGPASRARACPSPRRRTEEPCPQETRSRPSSRTRSSARARDHRAGGLDPEAAGIPAPASYDARSRDVAVA
jgi:hypothetical protein